MAEPIEVFISYCRKDRQLFEELVEHLRGPVQRRVISPWHDQLVQGGAEWEKEILERLGTAEIVLLLVSVHFLNAEFCRREVSEAIKQAKARKARIIPVIIAPCVWENEPYARWGALPKPLVPIASWRDRNEGWANVVREIEQIAKQIAKQIEEAKSSSRQRLVRRVARVLAILGIVTVAPLVAWGLVSLATWLIKLLPPLSPTSTPASEPTPWVTPPAASRGSRVSTKARGMQIIGGPCANGLNDIYNCACEGGGSGANWNCEGRRQVRVHCQSGRVYAEQCPKRCGTVIDHDDVCIN